MATRLSKKEDPAQSARHCLTDIPYRMVVFERLNQETPLYRVAGSAKDALGAEKALREAFKVHGGHCFYCKEPIKKNGLTIDHVEPEAIGQISDLQNLVIACQPCNAKKGCKPIESFHPEAGYEWLSALLAQVQDRLNRI